MADVVPVVVARVSSALRQPALCHSRLTRAMQLHLYRVTFVEAGAVVRSPFTLCLSAQKSPQPYRRHRGLLQVVSRWTEPVGRIIKSVLLDDSPS